MATRLLLPWEQDPLHPDAGWRVKATLEKSAIEGEGRGLCVREDVAEGAILRETTLVDASSLSGQVCEGLLPGTTLVYHSLDELLSTFRIHDKFDSRLDEISNFGSTPTSRKEIIKHRPPGMFGRLFFVPREIEFLFLHILVA